MTECAENRTLEERLRAVEDRLEILNLIASHPPSADTGADYYTVQVYAEDGVFDRGEHLSGGKGKQEIAAVMKSPGHQAAISGGLAHFASLPHIAIDGDQAVVTSYLQILTPQKTGDAVDVPNHGASRGFRIHRVASCLKARSNPIAQRHHDRRGRRWHSGTSTRKPRRASMDDRDARCGRRA
jgi:SnoaL-like domain